MLGGIHVAHISIPKAGELVNGDRAVCRRVTDKHILLGVIDGLGHGTGADEVATAAVEHLSTIALDSDIQPIIESLHGCLAGTRGAAATICLVMNGKLQACAVGNVELRCTETPLPLMFSPGILGVRVQKFRICRADLLPGTRLVMFSDGISTRLRHEDVRKLRPDEACANLLDRYRRAEDDATVLIADVE
jgi:negative regulator of sigma-B (phosphoserine phosphatase)